MKSETNWEKEGYHDGETATRTRGGTRGAEWNADAKGLTGSDREDYITGFEAAVENFYAEEGHCE